MKRIISFSLLIALCIPVAMYLVRGLPLHAFGENGAKAEAALHPVRPVPTATVRPAPDANRRTFPASVRATQRVELSFSVPGVLVELNAQTGRRVKKDEIIAKLDPRDYRNALDSAQAGFDEAKRNLERTRTLRQQNVTTQSELDSAIAAYDTAEAELRIRRKALEDTVLRAPFDGLVALRYVENHEHIKDKTPVVSLQNVCLIEVVFHVPERLMAEGGQEALQGPKVRFEAGSGDWLNAEVREVSASADSATRTYEVVVGLEAPENLYILPGMTAEVLLSLQTYANSGSHATLVPIEAVYGGSDGNSYVWVIQEREGHPEKVQVRMGGMRDNSVEVLSGLQPGQRVALAGLQHLSEEMVVRPMREGSEGLEE